MILGVNGVSIRAVMPPRYPGTVTGLHDRIERRGEASRRPSPADGRVILKQVRPPAVPTPGVPFTLPARCARWVRVHLPQRQREPGGASGGCRVHGLTPG